MMKFLAHISLLLALLAGAHGDYSYCKVVDTNSNYRLKWDLSMPGKIKFLVQAETSGWLGLGLSNGGEHPMISNGNRSDVWIGWVDVSSVSSCHQGCLYDYYVQEYQPPSLDATQSLTLLSASYSEGITTLEYSRDLITGDSYDRAIQVDGTTTFIWATNPSSRSTPSQDGTGLVKHQADTKGSFSVKLNAPSQCEDAAPTIPYSFSNEDGTYSVDWFVDTNLQTIEFTITAATKGWVGIGFNSEAKMVGSDVYVGWIDPTTGKAIMADHYADQYAMPMEDTTQGGTNDIIAVSSNMDGDDGITSITFRRRLDTRDKKDMVISEGKIVVVWAYGSDNSVNYADSTFTKHVAKGTAEIDLLNGPNESASDVNLFQVHAIIMIISVCLLIVPGFLVSHFFRALITKWFHIYASLQIIGTLGVVISSIIVFKAKDMHFEMGWHQVFGIVTLIAFLADTLLGIHARVKFNPLRKFAPVYPDKVHWWFGWVALLLAALTMLIGLHIYEASSTAILIYSVWVLIAVGVIGLLRRLVGRTKEDSLAYNNLRLINQDETDVDEDGDEIVLAAHRSLNRRQPLTVLYIFVIASVALLAIGFVYKDEPTPEFTPTPTNSFKQAYTFENFVIPNKTTNYWCRGFRFPVDQDYHIIHMEPLKDNQEMLHHMILYETTDDLGEDYFDCSEMPEGSSMLLGWAVGAGEQTLPDNVGIRIGKTAGKFAALQVHYDNPLEWSGRTDSSGVKLTLTTELREMDAGYLIVGALTSSISIPPLMSNFEITGKCDIDTVFSKKEDVLPEYTFMTAGLHMHMIGHQIYTDLYRPDPKNNGQLARVGSLGCDDYYSFNNQHGSELSGITLRAGDQLITHCMYNSSSRKDATLGCQSSSCEMCLNFLMYYPKLSGTAQTNCISRASIVANPVSKLNC